MFPQAVLGWCRVRPDVGLVVFRFRSRTLWLLLLALTSRCFCRVCALSPGHAADHKIWRIAPDVGRLGRSGRTVTIPLLMPGLIAAGCAFNASIRELGASIL